MEYSGLVFLGLCWLPVFPVCDKGLWHFGCNIKITSCVYTRVCLFVFNIIWHLNFASFGGVLYMFLMTHKLEDHCFYQSRADTDWAEYGHSLSWEIEGSGATPAFSSLILYSVPGPASSPFRPLCVGTCVCLFLTWCKCSVHGNCSCLSLTVISIDLAKLYFFQMLSFLVFFETGERRLYNSTTDSSWADQWFGAS